MTTKMTHTIIGIRFISFKLANSKIDMVYKV